MLTDTIYGLVGSALKLKTVERIYRLKKRDPKKPMIILIADLENLKIFNVKVDGPMKKIFKKFWPGPTSIILSCPDKKFEYLHRGTKTLAFRLPDDEGLIALLKKTRPLVAPSANIEGKKPAKNIVEAQKYFSDRIDFYIDDGQIKSKPSTLIKIEDGKIRVLRKG